MNNTQERGINLVDLFWDVCLQWRKILLFALIFMVLVGGYGYFRSRSSSPADSGTPDSTASTVPSEPETIGQQDIKLSEASMEKVNRYFEYVKLRDAQKDYNMHSPLMQLDAAGFYLDKITYYVDNFFEVEYPLVNKRDNTSMIASAYLMVLHEDHFITEMYKLLGETEDDKPYLKELIDVSSGYGDIIKTTASNNGEIEIFVYGKSDSSCKELARLVKTTIEGEREDLIDSFGEHDLILLEDVCTLVSDNGLRSYQKSQLDSYTTYENAAKGVLDALSEEEKLYIQLREEELQGANASVGEEENGETEEGKTENDETEKDMPASARPVFNLKYFVIGFVVGFFLGCLLIAFAYILNGKLRLVDDIESLYNIKLFGQIEMPKEPKKKKWFAFVDRFIIKLRDWNKHVFSTDEAISMVVAGVRISARNLEVSRIYVTGANIGENEKRLIKELSAKLETTGIKLIPGNPILYNAEALEESSEVGQILLMEKAGCSLCQEVADEIETCSYQGVKVLGMVMIA